MVKLDGESTCDRSMSSDVFLDFANNIKATESVARSGLNFIVFVVHVSSAGTLVVSGASGLYLFNGIALR